MGTPRAKIVKQQCMAGGGHYLYQVAQRATIAHLTASHQNILNSAQVKDFFLNWSRAAYSTVHGWIQPNFKLIQDYIVILVSCKHEEDPTKNEGAKELTSL